MKKRNTLQKSLVLKTVMTLANHPTADMVYDAVLRDLPSISRATVYRNLNSLAEDGLLTKICMANAPDRFDHNISPHTHTRCLSCKSLFDIPVSDTLDIHALPCDTFDVCGYEITFLGYCRECLKRRNAT